MKSLNDYQDDAVQFLRGPSGQLGVAIVAMGLPGEAGEACEVVKKSLRDGKPADLTKLTEELGDVLWYVAVLADRYGIALEDIAAHNIEKLQERYGKPE